MTIKAPATNFITPDDILDKEHPIAEAKTKLVKKFDVLQQVVVAGTSVTVLVVVPVDKQLHNRLHVVGGDQGLLLPLAGDQRHPAYRHHVRALHSGEEQGAARSRCSQPG